MNTQPSSSPSNSSSLRARITEDIKTAMKSRDQLSLDTLRYMLSVIKNAEIDLHREVTDSECVVIIQKEIKRRNEAIEQFLAGGRTEMAEDEKLQLAVLKKFVPTQLSEDEVRAEVSAIIAQSSNREFKVVIGQAMGALKSKADGSMISKIVRELTE